MNPTTLTTLPGPAKLPPIELAPNPVLPASAASADSETIPGTDRRLALRRNSGRALFKKVALACLIATCALGTVKMAYDWWTLGRFVQSTDDAYVGGDITVIAPKVSGFIAQLLVGDNQPVRAGDLLVRLDDRDYQAALARADAAVALAEASLKSLDVTRHWQEALVAQSAAEVASADAETTRAREDEVRYQDMVAKAVVSVASWQQVETTYQQDLAAGRKDRAAEAAAGRQLSVIDAQKDEARATLAGAVAERDQARLNLGYTELRAPVDGVVGNRSAQLGAYATAGSQLVSLVPAQGLWIDANFKEDQLRRIHPGEPATVRVDVLPGQVFHGHVASLAPATGAEFSVLPPENATGNFTKIVQRLTVRIVLDDPRVLSGLLRPGLSVTASVNTRAASQAGL